MSLGDAVKTILKAVWNLVVKIVTRLVDLLPDEWPKVDPYVVLGASVLLLLWICVTTRKVTKPKSDGDMATIVKIEGKTEEKDGQATVKCSELSVTFRFDNKKEVTLKIKPDAYGFIKKGDKGRLYYEGDQFRNFIR